MKYIKCVSICPDSVNADKWLGFRQRRDSVSPSLSRIVSALRLGLGLGSRRSRFHLQAFVCVVVDVLSVANSHGGHCGVCAVLRSEEDGCSGLPLQARAGSDKDQWMPHRTGGA